MINRSETMLETFRPKGPCARQNCIDESLRMAKAGSDFTERYGSC